MPLCVLLNITEKQAERANAILNANPCQLGRDACFLLPVLSNHVHLSHFQRAELSNLFYIYEYRKQMLDYTVASKQPTSSCL